MDLYVDTSLEDQVLNINQLNKMKLAKDAAAAAAAAGKVKRRSSSSVVLGISTSQLEFDSEDEGGGGGGGWGGDGAEVSPPTSSPDMGFRRHRRSGGNGNSPVPGLGFPAAGAEGFETTATASFLTGMHGGGRRKSLPRGGVGRSPGLRLGEQGVGGGIAEFSAEDIDDTDNLADDDIGILRGGSSLAATPLSSPLVISPGAQSAPGGVGGGPSPPVPKKSVFSTEYDGLGGEGGAGDVFAGVGEVGARSPPPPPPGEPDGPEGSAGRAKVLRPSQAGEAAGREMLERALCLSEKEGAEAEAELARQNSAELARQNSIERLGARRGLGRPRDHLGGSVSPPQANAPSPNNSVTYPPVNPLCQICSAVAEMQCSRCKRVRYCSAGCQTADWPAHRGFCFQGGFDLGTHFLAPPPSASRS